MARGSGPDALSRDDTHALACAGALVSWVSQPVYSRHGATLHTFFPAGSITRRKDAPCCASLLSRYVFQLIRLFRTSSRLNFNMLGGIAEAVTSPIRATGRLVFGDKKLKVGVVGAAGGIGQPLSLLLKLSPFVSELSLFDVADFTPGTITKLQCLRVLCYNLHVVSAAGQADCSVRRIRQPGLSIRRRGRASSEDTDHPIFDPDGTQFFYSMHS